MTLYPLQNLHWKHGARKDTVTSYWTKYTLCNGARKRHILPWWLTKLKDKNHLVKFDLTKWDLGRPPSFFFFFKIPTFSSFFCERRPLSKYIPDMRIYLDDGGDHLHPHLRPLHDAGVGRGDRRRPLWQRDREWRGCPREVSLSLSHLCHCLVFNTNMLFRWETGIHALRIVDTITMWFFTIGSSVTCHPSMIIHHPVSNEYHHHHRLWSSSDMADYGLTINPSSLSSSSS